MRCRSASITVVTCGDVRLLTSMCSAILRRMALSGITSPSPGMEICAGGWSEALGDFGATFTGSVWPAGFASPNTSSVGRKRSPSPGVSQGAGTAASSYWTGCSVCDCSINASTSFLVMRPPSPVPVTWVRSTLFSWASLETIGEIKPNSRLRPGARTAADCPAPPPSPRFPFPAWPTASGWVGSTVSSIAPAEGCAPGSDTSGARSAGWKRPPTGRFGFCHSRQVRLGPIR